MINEANGLQPIFEAVESKRKSFGDFANIDKDKLIFELWKIIDNIDTFGDMAKSNDKVFRSLTEKEQKKRWLLVDSDYIDLVYDKYYDASAKNGKPHKVGE